MRDRRGGVGRAGTVLDAVLAQLVFDGFEFAVVQRVVQREEVVGIGGSYVTSSDNEWLNEIILNLETQYTPERVYTDKSLSIGFDRDDEYIITDRKSVV